MNKIFHPSIRRLASLTGVACFVLVFGTGCELRKKMYDQPRLDPYETSDFFEDGMASRPIVQGSVPRGFLREDDHFYRGRVNDEMAETLPMPVTEELLARGRERYNIYCSVCHAPSGYGDGMVVQRGFKVPQSLHIERLRTAPDGYFFDVITRGFGMMPSYSYQVPPADRWAIIAYIRALQLSQYASMDDVPEAMRENLRDGKL